MIFSASSPLGDASMEPFEALMAYSSSHLSSGGPKKIAFYRSFARHPTTRTLSQKSPSLFTIEDW